MILVSIVIPVHNGEEFLVSCLQSVQVQTYTNLEIIIVNDASTDSTETIIDKFAKIDNRFLTLKNQHVKGVSFSRRLGVEKATGNYVIFVDADDYVSADMVQVLLENIDDNDFCLCNHYEDLDGKIYETDILTTKGVYEGEKLQRLRDGSIFLFDKSSKTSIYGMVWGILFKRELLIRNIQYFDEKLWFHEDHFLIIALLLDVKKIKAIENRLYYYRQHKRQTIRTYRIDYFDVNLLVFRKWQNLLKSKKCSEAMILSNAYFFIKNIETAIKIEVRDLDGSYADSIKFLKRVYHNQEVQKALEIVNLHSFDRSCCKYMTWLKMGWLSLIYFSLKLHK